MKKTLLTALSVITVLSASAGIEGTYVAEKYAGYSVGNSYTFATDEAWSSEDVEEGEDPTWEAVIANGSDGLQVTNLIGWDEVLNCTYNEETAELVIPAGQPVYTDDYGYVTYVCGGLDGYTTAQSVMDYCDANSGWIVETLGLKDVVLKLEDGALTASTPILLYIDYYPGYGYHGMPSSIYSELVLTAGVSGAEIKEGNYEAVKYTGYDTGSSYTFASGDEWSTEGDEDDETSSDNEEESEPWIITISVVDGQYTMQNLIYYGEDQEPCTFDAATGIITIAAGTTVYDDGYATKVCGGLAGYTSADGIMSYADSNNGWLYDSRALLDVQLKVDGDKITALTPIFVYTDYYPGMGYHGIAVRLISEMEMTYSGTNGITDLINESDFSAPIEYYNLQGLRIQNPAEGQIVIKRQGNKASKIIIR